jgi:alanyl-tRNA synthetase
MTSQELRQKYLDFFKSKDHKIIPSTSLIPSEKMEFSGTQKVLFVTAGMHPLVPYLLGEEHPEGRKLANVQKCLRTDDIDEVGDNTHNTFFEMLGNWSLGDYWKKEAIEWSFEFLTKELNLPVEKLAVSVFAGDSDAPFDSESFDIWKGMGIPESRIGKLPKKDNWWGPVGETGPCGPDTEMFYWTGVETAPENFDSNDSNWIEIWNDVFMQYNKKIDGSFEELAQRNVDTGMGLERALAVINGKKSIYETDLFEDVIETIENMMTTSEVRYIRIIADHIRAATFLIAAGVIPGNTDRGYVLRRLIRRAIRSAYRSGIKSGFTSDVAKKIIDKMGPVYNELSEKESEILSTLQDEEEKFQTPINWLDQYRQDLLAAKTSKLIKKIGQTPILTKEGLASGEYVFENYQTYGVPPDLAEDIIEELNLGYDKEAYNKVSLEHQEKSRTASAGMFKGGLAGHSEIETKYHTTTHLLHQALRDVLGMQVFQKGSNITTERLRFDFSFDRKVTDEEIKKTEEIMNQRIKEDLVVDRKFMTVDEAKKLNAIGLFNEKYGEEVSIYLIGPNFKLDTNAKDQRDRGGYYSAEFCGGPHVDHTGVIGEIKIVKEEAVSAGVRRIRVELVN